MLLYMVGHLNISELGQLKRMQHVSVTFNYLFFSILIFINVHVIEIIFVIVFCVGSL
jgi:hypothetical protein